MKTNNTCINDSGKEEMISNFNLVLEEINKDHGKLLDIFNMLYEAVKQKKPEKIISSLINDVAEYSDYHFNREKGLMDECEYSGKTRHLKMHETFKDYVERAKILGEASNPVNIGTQLVELLAQWLTYHISEIDEEMITEIKKKKLGEILAKEMGQGSEQAPEEMFYDSFSLNERLVNNTFEILEDGSRLKSLSCDRLSLKDSLTGLNNSSALLDCLPVKVAKAEHTDSILAVGMMDIDGFKLINDSYGHKAGDFLLREFAGRLKKSIHNSDFLARIGSDKFVLIMENINKKEAHSYIISIMNRIHNFMEHPFKISNGEQIKATTISMSMGVAFFPNDTTEGKELLMFAEKAMYKAKREKTFGKALNWWRSFSTI